MKLSLVINNTPINIKCVYRSPSSDINEFSTIYVNILKDEINNKGYHIIIEDMNINIMGSKFINNKYLDKLSEYEYDSLINVFTRTSLGNKHSCLDRIFVKSNSNVNGRIEAGVLQTTYSTVLSIEIKNKNQQIMNNVNKTINYNKFNEISMKENWNEEFNNINVNECFDTFIDKVDSVTMTTTTKTANSKNK